MTTHPKRSRIRAHHRHHRIGVEGVAGVTDLVRHAILQEPMHQDHVRPAQIFAAGDVLAPEAPVVRDELQVEARDEDSGVAVALGRPVDRVLPAPEGEVRGVERAEQHRGVDPVPGHVDEDGVALELAQLHRGRQGAHDRVGQVLEDVLGVVELGSCEVRRVAADVGEGKAARLGLPNRRMSRAGRVRHPLSVLPQMPAASGLGDALFTPGDDGEDAPLPRHALQLVPAAILEAKTGPGDGSRTVLETRIPTAGTFRSGPSGS